MTIAIGASGESAFDRLSGTARAHAIDRWIYVFTAASLIAVILIGFIPDSIVKIAAVNAGHRAPFPLILHIHAVLMASFLALLLGQTVLVATGRRAWHMQLGVAGLVLAPLIVITGIVLAPTIYHGAWNAAQTAPAATKPQAQALLGFLENVLLLQMRSGIMFAVCMWIALSARRRDPGLHKRMVLLAVAAVVSAATDRIGWLPINSPFTPLSADLYSLLAVSPMLIWDLVRNRGIHRAYLLFMAFYLPVSVPVYALWNTPLWHAAARHIMGV